MRRNGRRGARRQARGFPTSSGPSPPRGAEREGGLGSPRMGVPINGPLVRDEVLDALCVSVRPNKGGAMEQRNAIVTGGLRGLGLAMALGLARDACRVLAVGHIETDVAAIERELDGTPLADASPAGRRSARPQECNRVVAAAEARFGGIDILVNNAGLTFTYDGDQVAHHATPTLSPPLTETSAFSVCPGRCGNRMPSMPPSAPSRRQGRYPPIYCRHHWNWYSSCRARSTATSQILRGAVNLEGDVEETNLQPPLHQRDRQMEMSMPTQARRILRRMDRRAVPQTGPARDRWGSLTQR